MTKTHGGEINPKKITEARLARGYNMADTAALVKVSRQAMLRYEQGLSTPSDKVLLALSESLEFPIGFFYNNLELNTTEGAVFFRSMKTAESRYRAMVKVRCNWVGLIYAYLSKYLNLPPVHLPKTDFLLRKDNLTEEDIENCAYLLRKEWKLGNHPIGNLCNIMENNGLIIFGAKIDNYKVDACHKMVSGRPLIFVTKDKTSCCRFRFSLAHEIGHMMLHSYITEEDLNDKKILDRIEKEANYFASAFLFPKEEVFNDVYSSNLNFLLMLKKKWKVSLAAIVHRCSKLGIFDEDVTVSLYRQISYRKWRTIEPFDKDIPMEQPRLLSAALKILFDNNLVTRQQFVNIFDLPVDELAQLSNVEATYFDDVPHEVSISIMK